MPTQPFEAWLRSVLPKAAKLVWESNDCGEQTGDPATTPADPPVCAQATAKLADGRDVVVMIAVGTVKKGITGQPEVFFITIEKENTFDQVRSLHELPAAL